jgi:WD40 repeat protein
MGVFFGETSIEGIAPSPESPWVATPGESSGISVRNSRTGKVLHELQGHQGRVNFLAVHPNGRRLFSAGLDGIIRRWDMSRFPAKPVCDLAMEALPDDNWVVWTDPEDADGPNRYWSDYSPGAKRWLGWHAPVPGTDRWAHQPMDAFPDRR